VYVKTEITFSEPICGCQRQNIRWGIFIEDLEPGLRVYCVDCQTEIKIPHGQFRASVTFEKPYPGSSAVKPPAKVLSIVPSGEAK